MAFWDFLTGKPEKFKQQSLHTKEQKQGLKDYLNQPIDQNPLYNQGSNYIQQLLSNDPAAMQQFQEPYMRNFEQNIAPGIAERFAGGQGYGGTGGGALYSSAFQNSISQAGANLQSQLAALRSGMQQTGANQALQYAQQPYSNLHAGLQVRPFENTYQARQPGLFETGLMSYGQGGGGGFGGGQSGSQGGGYGGIIGSALGSLLGPAGTVLGGMAGSAAGNYFGGGR